MFVMKPIRPHRFKYKEYQRVMRNALKRAGRVIAKDFDDTAKTWTNKPKFKVRTSATARKPSPSMRIVTDDENWNRVDQGTGIYIGRQPYPIVAGAYTGKSKAKALFFYPDTDPKTHPGVFLPGPGSKGGYPIMRKSVMHKGIRPRHFTEYIANVREPWFQRQMQLALFEFAKKSGHAIYIPGYGRFG